MGKGDKRRPTYVDEETLARRWERVFGKRPLNGGRQQETENDEKGDQDVPNRS